MENNLENLTIGVFAKAAGVNVETIRFYQRAGYHEISRIKDFYRIEDDKVVFCKQLTAP